jgi:hypothetical protein
MPDILGLVFFRLLIYRRNNRQAERGRWATLNANGRRLLITRLMDDQ